MLVSLRVVEAHQFHHSISSEFFAVEHSTVNQFLKVFPCHSLLPFLPHFPLQQLPGLVAKTGAVISLLRSGKWDRYDHRRIELLAILVRFLLLLLATRAPNSLNRSALPYLHLRQTLVSRIPFSF